MNMAQFKRLVAAATGTKRTHRIRGFVTLSTAGANPFPLLSADDDPDYDVGGVMTSTPLECEAGARILGIELSITVRFLAAGRYAEFMIYKDVDSIMGGSISPSWLFLNDLTANVALLRKYAVAYGFMLASTNNENKTMRVRISRAALRRAGVMNDGDKLHLNIETSAGTDNLAYVTGRIWTRK